MIYLYLSNRFRALRSGYSKCPLTQEQRAKLEMLAHSIEIGDAMNISDINQQNVSPFMPLETLPGSPLHSKHSLAGKKRQPFLRTDSIKSREDIFFEKKSAREDLYSSELRPLNTKINKLLGDRFGNLHGDFDWVLFENKLFNVKQWVSPGWSTRRAGALFSLRCART